MDLVKYLLILTLFTTVVGQVSRVKFVGGLTVLTPTDILVVVLCAVSLVYFLGVRKKIQLTPKTFIPILIFSAVALAGDFLATLYLPFREVAIGSFFLIRFLALYFISQIVVNLIPEEKVNNWVNLILVFGVVFILLGFIQLIFYPDLTKLTAYGWDPHQMRIVSTFLDPNYAGIVYVILFALSSSYLLFRQTAKKVVVYSYLLVALLSLAATVLTFSRSSYLALFVAVLVLSAIKSKKLLLIMLIVFLTLFIIVPQARNRILGAISIDETSRARIESWENAIYVFSKNPVFGVGFNTYRFTQARYNLFTLQDPLGGNSGSGSDSSILLVAATTGIVGLTAFLYLIVSIVVTLFKKASKNPISLAALAIFAALLVHTQFVNSFFYPQIMLLVWCVVGLAQTYDS